jgi:hypothetical protein
MEYLELYNTPKAEVHPGHKLTGPKEEKEDVSRNTTFCGATSNIVNILWCACVCNPAILLEL